MELTPYLLGLSRTEREALAKRCGVSSGHLNNVAYGTRPCSPKLAVALERETLGQVTRQRIRKNDWADHWPELLRRAA